jgi:hypothetical protein
MNINRKWIITTGASIGLALAALTVSAQTAPVTPAAGQSAREGSPHGMKGGRHHGPRAKAERQTYRQLMTREERSAFRSKMRAAKTPQERQQIAMANRAELHKRAAEKGITLPEHRGPHARDGRGRHHGASERNSSSAFPASPPTID